MATVQPSLRPVIEVVWEIRFLPQKINREISIVNSFFSFFDGVQVPLEKRPHMLLFNKIENNKLNGFFMAYFSALVFSVYQTKK